MTVAAYGNGGANYLARVLSERMQREAQVPPVLDFGSIGTDYSLKTNSFPVAIPIRDYTICRGLTLGKEGDLLTVLRTGNPPPEVAVSERMRGLKPGDRVLVAWVEKDPVVIDLIFPAEEGMS